MITDMYYFNFKHARFILFLIALALLAPSSALAKQTTLPISLDYRLLKSLVIHKMYKEPGQTATVYDLKDGCNKITLSHPKIAPMPPAVLVETKIKINVATPFAGSCYAAVEWSGFLELKQIPYFEKDSWILRFDTKDSRLYDSDHNPSSVSGFLYDLIKEFAQGYLNKMSVNLAPPVDDIKEVIAPMFPGEFSERGIQLVESFRPGDVRVNAKAVEVDIFAEIDDTVIVPEPVKALTNEELDKFTKSWETWDSFLVMMIAELSSKPLADEERQTLLDVLLETRHSFVTALSEKSLDKHFVRNQFTSTWDRLADILKQHLNDIPDETVLGYLTFFSAGDALSVLDKVGPTLGIELNRDGLIRFARLMGNNSELVYKPGVDKKLQESLGIGEADESADIESEEIEIEEIDLDSTDADEGSTMLELFFFSPAWAKSGKGNVDLRKILPWIVTKKNYDSYLKDIRSLVDKSADETAVKKNLDTKYHPLFKRLSNATAWQESCFRQFKVKNNKARYLRSYNRSSVGLMQINERVWRGIYNKKKLQWDIEYNARAGTEVLELYLRKYALRKMDKSKPFNNDTLARLVYAMYNGGPGQYRKLLKRKASNRYYRSDRLFWEKYGYVREGDWDKLKICLFGK